MMKIFLALALVALAPLAAADTTCVGTTCVTHNSGTYGEGTCDAPAPYASEYSDLRVDAPLGNGYGVHAWTYNGCAAYDDGSGGWSWSWFYANAAVMGGGGQMYAFVTGGWTAGDGATGHCYVYYTAWDAFTGSGGYGRPCNVGDVYPQPPVLP